MLEWYNRGLQSQEKTNSVVDFPAGVSDTPLVVSKYRVDAAKLKPDELNMTPAQLEGQLKNRWKSQVSLTAADVKAGDIELGKVDFEAGISVSFSKTWRQRKLSSLPAYFINWNGTCLSIPDPLPEKLNQLDEIKDEVIKTRTRTLMTCLKLCIYPTNSR